MMDLESRLSLVEHPFGISMEEEWTSACMEPVSSRRCPVLTLVRAGRDRVAVPNLDFHSLSSFTLVAHFQTLPNVEMQVQLF